MLKSKTFNMVMSAHTYNLMETDSILATHTNFCPSTKRKYSIDTIKESK